MSSVIIGGEKMAKKNTATQKKADWEAEKTNSPNPNSVPQLRQRLVALENAYDALYALVQELTKGN